jgi:hypothetical protein
MAKPSIYSNPPASPIEVWLSQANIGIACNVVHEDESTEHLEADSLSMRGAQREITGHLIELGYQPAGRWGIEERGPKAEPAETSRKFRLAVTRDARP